jgi:hypothetical protein
MIQQFHSSTLGALGDQPLYYLPLRLLHHLLALPTSLPPPHTPLAFIPIVPYVTMQDTDAMVKRNGGKPPLTMQSFTKLVDKAGDPPAALVVPSIIPPPGHVVEAWGSPLEVPTLQEVGFTGTPTTIFKVFGNGCTAPVAHAASVRSCSRIQTACDLHMWLHPCLH